MGEGRVRVRLSNPFDLRDVRLERLSSDKVRTYEAEAMVGTGAVHLVLPPFVVETLGVDRPFRQMAEYADGRREEVDVTEPVLIEILGRRAYEEALVLGDEVLVGQTTLEKMDLHVDCRQGRLMPNPAHPDQPITKVK